MAFCSYESDACLKLYKICMNFSLHEHRLRKIRCVYKFLCVFFVNTAHGLLDFNRTRCHFSRTRGLFITSLKRQTINGNWNDDHATWRLLEYPDIRSYNMFIQTTEISVLTMSVCANQEYFTSANQEHAHLVLKSNIILTIGFNKLGTGILCKNHTSPCHTFFKLTRH